jgi:hypothetical protein
MDKQDKGGPAFPSQTDQSYLHGMFLRDWFAGQALAGGAAASIIKVLTSGAEQEEINNDLNYWAKAAYRIADAMLQARK